MKKRNSNIWFLCLTYIVFVVCSGSTYNMGSINNIKKSDSNVTIPDNQLKIMTFNIRVGCGRDNMGLNPNLCTPKKENLDLVAMAIRSEDPDVIALQEVKGYSQAEYIAKKLNMNFTYISHGEDEWWGLAVLSNFEILNSNFWYINPGDIDNVFGDDPRNGLICGIKINDNLYQFVNIHYYHLGDYETQVSSTMKIINEIKGPVILLGDFNREDWYTGLKPVQDSFIDTCKSASTENSKNVLTVGTGFRRIDYIFVQDKYFTVLDAGIYSLQDFYDASDHFGYYTILKVKQ